MTPLVPTATRTGATLTVSHPLPMTVRFFVLYRQDAGTWTLVNVSGGPQATFPVSPGTWAVSAIGRGGAESQGVQLVVP
jgi:hypothetical protein